MNDLDQTANIRGYGFGLLMLRVVAGIIFIAHGYLKAFKMGMGGTVGFMTHLGIPASPVAAYFSVLAELLGGAALILGIFTLPFGIALTIDMLGAIWFAKRGGGLMAPKGFELELLLLASAFCVALIGPGPISLRRALSRNTQ
ncbi:MAG: DoxX family protein [Gemmatimonadaceae bacterium]